MNSTSFSLPIGGEPNSCTSNSSDKNIDSSSTAHLTLNAATGGGRAARSSAHSSDSNPEASPSVAVLDSSSGIGHFHMTNNNKSNHRNGNNHHHHHQLDSGSMPRPARLIAGGFSISNRLHLTTKHQRTMWSRATHFEKILLIGVILLIALSTIIFLSLMSIIVRQRSLIESMNSTTTGQLHEDQQQQQQHRATATTTTTTSADMGAPRPPLPPTISAHYQDARNYCLSSNCVKVAASVIEAIDLTVDPCEDFYMYSCGDWIKSNPLPDGKSNWGTFSKLWQDNQSIMRAVLEEGANFMPGSAEEKAKIYYESCLDRNDTVELRGTQPMRDLIESAGGWNISGQFDVKTWDLQGSLQIYHNQYNRGGLFSWAVGADERNSTRNIIQLDQGGLGLPSRDYYLNKTDKNVLDAYYIYMVKVAELMGGVNVEEQMKDILEFEKKLAAITVPQDQRRDDERMYHKFALKDLSNKSPFLNWTKYFDDAFDYHSRTTISFSSEIRPRTGAKVMGNDSNIANLAKYVLADAKSVNINESQPAAPAAQQAQSGAGGELAPPLQQQQRRAQISSTISKHKITEDENIVIYSPEYFEDLSALVQQYTATERGKVTLANYMAWSVIQSLIATLPKNFRDASKVLRKTLIGSEGIEVSWRYCVTDTNQVMGFALGSLFVRRVFQGKSKERAEEMIYSIRNAFKDNLPNLSWMDDRTRQLAREKADHINQMIGFPDFILSPEKLNGKYEGLELDENNYFENNIKVNVLSLRENMEKINKPANKTEWEMTPPMVNAYYTPTKNQIVFPAGILQTPFYDLSYPNSLNYGAMGVVMGHELTHAFDDQGREYDKDGNLYQWWYNETLRNFEGRVKCFVDQYSTYKIDDNHLNGKQTLGENIADNGGLKAAFRAYEKWAEHNPEPRLPGLNLTSKQLFFVGFAQVWCSISTPEALKLQVLNDPHAPAQFRVIGTLSNSQEFAREFNCTRGANMNPDKKCVVW